MVGAHESLPEGEQAFAPRPGVRAVHRRRAGAWPSAVIRRRVIVHGRVQGVGFRLAVMRAAAARGVAGWVRNRWDGTVEAVFEGEADAVGALVRVCGEGPRGAVVQRVETVAEQPEGLAGFDVR